MASYVTPQQLRVLLTRDPEQPAGTAAELADVALQVAIDTATAFIDASLVSRYQVPFPDPPPALIVQLTLAMAAYHADTMHRQSVDIEAGDPVLRRHNWAVGVLDALGAGQIDLPDTQPTSRVPDGVTPLDAYTGVLFTHHNFGLRTYQGGYQSGVLYVDDGRW
jgi:phage gp36-like protein